MWRELPATVTRGKVRTPSVSDTQPKTDVLYSFIPLRTFRLHAHQREKQHALQTSHNVRNKSTRPSKMPEGITHVTRRVSYRI